MQNLNSLIDNLNKTCKRSLEEAAQLCVSETHFTIDLEHFLRKLLEHPATDLTVILKYYEIDAKKTIQQLKTALNQFKRGNSKTPGLSPNLVKLLERAWVMASLHLKQTKIRSAALLLALLKTEELLGAVVNNCPELLRIPRNQLEEDLKELMKASPEESSTTHPSEESSPKTGTPALDKFTIDLTKQAALGKIDPIEGRDNEIRQMIDILSRRRQNNPILTGDAGVGKTAIVEGLALRIHAGTVPESLKNVSIRTLDLGLLEAGAGIKGEFEQRLKSVIEEVQGSLKPIILFIDEAHTLIGAKDKNNDAANLLKPALARGELRTIAATTWGEYKRYFEKDPALTRRFQVVTVREPDEKTAIRMLRGLTHKLEQHHQVLILDQALQDAVKLSNRYIGERRLPDKAVSLLDTACARVHVAQHAIPSTIEDLNQTIQALTREKAMLEKEEAQGHGHHKDKCEEIQKQIKSFEKELEGNTNKWQEELALVQEIRILQADENSKAKEKIQTLRKKLEAMQKEETMVPLCVTTEVVAQVISSWTGIPLGKMVRNEIDTLLSLEKILGERLIGQKSALNTLAKHIITYRANLDEPGKPVGVFLLAGPSGVGKTETALALAESLYGGERNLITLNMSEYQEAHSVSGLKGSPPGYVGYGQGGVLTEAVRHSPHSVILLDEIEKAHKDVLELFYQVFDKGMLDDAEGVTVDFKNTIILMTTNLGTETIKESRGETEDIIKALRPELVNHFKPALLGRMVVVPFLPLSEKEIHAIVRLKMDKISKRFEENHRAKFSYDQGVIDKIADRCEDPDSGARNIDAIINQNILPLLSAEVLKHVAEESPFDNITLAIKGDAFTCSFKTRTALQQG
jgi:type VI secretion system protein VasG